MRKIKVGCAMNRKGCRIEAEIEVEDNATADEVEQQIREWAYGQFEYWSEEA